MSRRLLLHIIVAVLFWLLFGYYWWLVSRRQVTAETVRAVRLLLAITVAVWALTTLWMEHNRRKYGGRPDRRTRRRAAPPAVHHDTLGRPIVEHDAGELTVAPYIEISIDPDTASKRFDALTPPDGEEVAS